MELDEVRERLRQFSDVAAQTDDPLSWFEELYSWAEGNSEWIPWDKGEPNLLFASWPHLTSLEAGQALVVGCGLGDDSVLLAGLGWKVTAFDLSPSAVKWAAEKHEEVLKLASGTVDWQVADITNTPTEWKGAFDLVLEVHLLQAIPEPERSLGSQILPILVAEGGHLLCVGRIRTPTSDMEGPPWPLERQWVLDIGEEMELSIIEEFELPDDEPGIVRYRAVWRQGAAVSQMT